MTIWEIILVAIGLSLDVYAVVVLYSAMLVRIEKRKLASMCLIFAGWQILAVLVGTLITHLPFFEMVSTQVEHLWDVISVVIFFALGAYMLYKAGKHEVVFEHRSEINYKKVCVAALITSLDAFSAAIDLALKSIRKDREKGLLQIVDLTQKFMGDNFSAKSY